MQPNQACFLMTSENNFPTLLYQAPNLKTSPFESHFECRRHLQTFETFDCQVSFDF